MITILVVDDTKSNRDYLQKVLSDAGFNVLLASSGREGLDMLSSNKVDIVLSDVNMPEMGGFEMTERIKKQDSNQEVIMYTAMDTPADLVTLAKKIGAYDLLSYSSLKDLFNSATEKFRNAIKESNRLSNEML